MSDPLDVLEAGEAGVGTAEAVPAQAFEAVELLAGPRAFHAALSGHQRRLATLAIREAARLFPHDASDDGPRLAVRQAYWAALLMFHLGLSNALAATGAQEKHAGAGRSAARRAMDDVNNARGFEIGLGCAADATDRHILLRVVEAHQRGELRVLRPDARQTSRRR
jgi:hypothetical protein